MNISTQINKRSFGKKYGLPVFSLWEAGLQGAVCQPQKSLTMAALAVRCHLIQIRLVNLYQSCNFYHDQLPGFLREDNNRIQSLRSEWNNRVLVHVSWTSISLPLQQKSSATFLILVIRPELYFERTQKLMAQNFYSNTNTRQTLTELITITIATTKKMGSFHNGGFFFSRHCLNRRCLA